MEQSGADCSTDAEENCEEGKFSMEELSRVQFPDSLRIRIEGIDFFGAAARSRELLFNRHRAWQ